MLDENLWEIGKFQIYVKPEYNDVIVPKISKLTGITNEMVANAPTFSVAFKQFTDWCLNIKDDVMIYAWSNTDHSQVMKEIQLKQYKLSEEEHKLMEHGWTDFQNEFDIHLGFERQISLKLALDMADYTKKSFGMFGGKEQTIKLLVHNSLAGVIIDRFGKDIMMIPIDEQYFTVNVDVHVSRQFLGWVFSLGEKVKLLGPDEVVEEMKAEIRRLNQQYQI